MVSMDFNDPRKALEIASRPMKLMEEIEERHSSEVQKFYKDAVIFVTGGTGFVGKQLIEKLLRACRDLKKIYVLTRDKKGVTLKNRLLQQFKDPLYDELRRRYPKFEEKIFPIEGELTQLRLGIKDDDWKLLVNEVTIIIHGAAIVRFDEPLKTAIITNVRGTREILTLARECRGLISFVYVSTAYSNCHMPEIEERFYDSPVPADTMIEFVEHVSEERIDAITQQLVQGWPNTYTFSKAISEDALRVYGKGLPICVVRPAIVLPTYKEPCPGWLDFNSVNGPSGMIFGTGMGFVRVFHGNREAKLDLVPLDYVNNLVITATWETGMRYRNGDCDPKIYMLSRNRNPITFGMVSDFLGTKARNFVSPKAIWYCYGITTPYKYLYFFYTLIFHTIPALLVDTGLSLAGHKLRFARIYNKAHKLLYVLSHFISNSWTIRDENTQYLFRKLSKDDRKIFDFDMIGVDFRSFMVIWCCGIRLFIIKDNLLDTEYAKKKQFWLKLANYAVILLYLLIFYKILMFSFATFGFVFNGITSVVCASGI